MFACSNCWLVQLPAPAAAEELFTADYAYYSSTSSSWCAHAERFVDAADVLKQQQQVQRIGG